MLGCASNSDAFHIIFQLFFLVANCGIVEYKSCAGEAEVGH